MGWPVGYALEPLHQRYAELSTDLASLLQESDLGEPVDDQELADLYVSSLDARDYVLLGDPAVRLNVSWETPSQMPPVLRGG